MPDDQIDLLQESSPVKLTSEQVRVMLRRTYCEPEWALMEEVAPRTGGGTRYADAVAFGLWASRGHQLIGFEIKVSRSDWLNELKNPAKVEESVYSYCDRWIVVAPKDIVREGELPPTWGLLEAGTTLRNKVAAPQLTPAPLSRTFFASIMRRGLESLNERARRMTMQAQSAAEESFADRVRLAVAKSARDHEELLAKIKRVKDECGFDPIGEKWEGPPADAMNLAIRLTQLDGWQDNPLGKLTKMLDSLDEARHHIAAAIEESGLRPKP